MDKRELILQRLVVIAGTIAGVNKVFRNENTPNEKDLPAIIILDADEKADETDPEGRGPTAPRRMVMMPQCFILLPGAASSVGTTMNGLRALLIDAVANDAPLTALTNNHRGARLLASQTSLAWGRSMLGEMGITFAIPYLLHPGQVAG